MDTDLHGLTIDDGTNLCKEICVGKHVWVCSNVTVKKGAFIPSGCVLGSDTLVSKEFSEEKCLIVGSPAYVKKEMFSGRNDRRHY